MTSTTSSPRTSISRKVARNSRASTSSSFTVVAPLTMSSSTESNTPEHHQGNMFSIVTADTVSSAKRDAHDTVEASLCTSPSARSNSGNTESGQANTTTVHDTHHPQAPACKEQDAHSEESMSEFEPHSRIDDSHCTPPDLQHASAEQHVEPRTRDIPAEVHTAPIQSSDEVTSSDHVILAPTPTPAQKSEDVSSDRGDAHMYKFTAHNDGVSGADVSQASGHTTQGHDVNHAATCQNNQLVVENSTKAMATSENARRASTASVHGASAVGHAKSEDTRETSAAAGTRSDTEQVRVRSFASSELRSSTREARRRSSHMDAEEMWAMRDRYGDVCRYACRAITNINSINTASYDFIYDRTECLGIGCQQPARCAVQG